MTHEHFYRFEAKDNAELGRQMGEIFSKQADEAIVETKENIRWEQGKGRAAQILEFQNKYFPKYTEELRAYADGAGVDFLDLYAVSLEGEIYNKIQDHCTTIVTNHAFLLAHNEDWDKGSERKICVVEKKIGELTILELFYYNTLGGNSVSINSNGFVVAVNSLTSKNFKLGLPRNVIARAFSETKNLIEGFENMPRGGGYNFNILDSSGEFWNIEYDSENYAMTRPKIPFSHTNHYLDDRLKKGEANPFLNTYSRYEGAQKVSPKIDIDGAKNMLSDDSQGPDKSILNERTIASVVVDLSRKFVHIFLLREKEKGWVAYPLPW
jgi:hypothetical protein